MNFVYPQNSVKSIKKPPLAFSDLSNWSSVGDGHLSNDGKYVWYTLSDKGKSCLVVKSLSGDWEKHFPFYSSASFVDRSRKIILKNFGDSLCIINLGSSTENFIAGVKEFKVIENQYGESLLYILKSPERTMVIEDILSMKKYLYENVSQYFLHQNGRTLCLKKRNFYDQVDSIYVIDLVDKKQSYVYSAKNIDNIIFSTDASQIAFQIKQDTAKSIIHYDLNEGRAQLLDRNFFQKKIEKFELENIIRFDKQGDRLFLQMKETFFPRAMDQSVKVDVWNFQDKKLQSEQLLEKENNTYLFVIDLSSYEVRRLQMKNEEIRFSENDSLAIVTENLSGSEGEWNWNKYSRNLFFLLNTFTGEKHPLQMSNPYFLPSGKYVYGRSLSLPSPEDVVIVYDLKKTQYKNITRYINIEIQRLKRDKGANIHNAIGFTDIANTYAYRNYQFSICGFSASGDSVLIRDGFDIWMVDLNAVEKPLCITNQYGRKNRLGFNTVDFITSFGLNKKLLLKAFDEKTKGEGYFNVIFGQQKNPEMVNMHDVRLSYSYPRRSKDAEVYIVKQEAADNAPNLFWTTDFRIYHRLTNTNPERSYNWMKSELIQWKSFDGTILQAALYKPEDFDPQKKYPVIFLYYQTLSQDLNKYRRPSFSSDRLDIPWFVSRGYIVCTPDIQYKIEETGKSAFDAIVSCAKFVKKFAWVNGERMGLQGHSFGAYETNYIITHSNLFAAAVSASGICDIVADYGSLVGSEAKDKKFFFENHQYRMGASLWEIPDKYITSSPILRAHKVSTPLLMMNNKADKGVSFNQGIEFFTALRRLGKRVWMLQYDDGNHSLDPKSDAALDYTIRMQQFLDHYLRDSACPRWMLFGIPAKMKGIDNGYELVKEKDKNGKWVTPKEGVLFTDKQRREIDAIKNRKPITLVLE